MAGRTPRVLVVTVDGVTEVLVESRAHLPHAWWQILDTGDCPCPARGECDHLRAVRAHLLSRPDVVDRLPLALRPKRPTLDAAPAVAERKRPTRPALRAVPDPDDARLDQLADDVFDQPYAHGGLRR